MNLKIILLLSEMVANFKKLPENNFADDFTELIEKTAENIEKTYCFDKEFFETLEKAFYEKFVIQVNTIDYKAVLRKSEKKINGTPEQIFEFFKQYITENQTKEK